MSFVKIPGEGEGEAVAGAAVEGLAQGAANAASELPFFDEKAITSSAGRVGGALGGVAGAVAGVAGAALRKLAGGGSGNLDVEVASGDVLHVRQFSIHEQFSALFDVSLLARSENPSIDFDEVVGQHARFSLHAGTHDRSWAGLCNHIELVGVDPDGLSTYQVSIVPTLWLLSQRKNYRMFQQISEPDIVLQILSEWDIVPDVRIDKAAYKKRKYRVQYAESDLAFIQRMLEDAGICYFFEDVKGETKLVLSDGPQTNPSRLPPLPFMDDVTAVRKVELEFVTAVRMSQRVRPGKVTLRDHDYRRPASYKLMKTAAAGRGVEEKLERFHYTPGAFLFGTDQGDATPNADDRGRTRTDEKEGAIVAQKRLDAKRGTARVCGFETNAHDLAPGVVMSIVGHPHAALGRALLIVKSSLAGTDTGEWSHQCEARGTEIPFRPELATPKPKANGVESATVVGPAGEEIHTDEFGRVRVHFHWDRESKMDDKSSCWIHVSQPWGGSGYGGTNLPRIGQEVLIDFLGGDPDRPVIVGRLYTNLQKTPYKLPDNKTQSGWRSNSTGGTGGYNEIMFEDAQGKELINIQAEKDLKKLVKNNESVTIGQNLTKSVGANEREVTGQNRSIAVGVNRSSQVGQIDSTMVGDTHVVFISPPEEGLPGKNTSWRMTKKKIVLDTGAGATITLQNSTIILSADFIRLRAKKRLIASGRTGVSLRSARQRIVIGGQSVDIGAAAGAVSIHGSPLVTINGPGMPSARLLDLAPDLIYQGSPTVLVGLSPPGFPLHPTFTPRPGEDPRVTAMRVLLQGSPAGQHALELMDANNVPVNFAAGGGSFYSPTSGSMTLDASQPLIAQSLIYTHEMNHAEYDLTGRGGDATTMSRGDYINSMVAEEAQGTVLSIEAQREMAANGLDVGGTSFPLQAAYEQAYDQAVTDYTASHPGATQTELDAAGRQAGYNAVEQGFHNGSVVTSNTGAPYPDYYGSYWDSIHPTGP